MVGSRITRLHPEEPSSWRVGGLRRGPSTGAQRPAGHLASGCPGTAGDPRKRRRPGTTRDAFHLGRGRQRAGSCRPPRHVPPAPDESRTEHAECRRPPADERHWPRARSGIPGGNARPRVGGSRGCWRGAGAKVSDPGWLMSPASPSDGAKALSDAPRHATASSRTRYRMLRLNSGN